jgi:hypothetical protein
MRVLYVKWSQVSSSDFRSDPCLYYVHTSVYTRTECVYICVTVYKYWNEQFI